MVGMQVWGLALLLAAPEPPPTPPVDLEALLATARRVQDADYAAWKQFRFRRLVDRQRLNKHQQVIRRDRWEFAITPLGDRFDEKLVRIDGRAPKLEEVREHRKAARFTRHYRTISGSEAEDPEEGIYSLQYLLRMPDYRYGGVEVIDGIRCHRLDFEPLRGGRGKGLAGKIGQAMAGTLWLTEEKGHLYRATANSRRPVPVALGLARVADLKVRYQSAPVPGGVWLPTEILVRTQVSVLGRKLRKRNLYQYTDYTPNRRE